MTVKVSTTDMCDLSPIQVQGRVIMRHALLRLPIECMQKFLIVYEAFEQKGFEIFVVGQGVLQMSQISGSCVIVSVIKCF